MGIKVFWLEPTTSYRLELRRFASPSTCAAKPYGMSCHDARVDLGIVESPADATCYSPKSDDDPDAWKTDRILRGDRRWPSKCACGYVFTADDHWQVNYEKLYEARGGARDGERHTLRDAPVGAMWDATWYRRDGEIEGPHIGPDGLCLVVQTPGGPWLVDGEASNCTRTQWGPKEIDGQMHQKVWLGRTHFCWVRHGNPRTGTLHVDKSGNTCAAGAGSIQIGGYHGFLHHGELTNA